MDQFDAVIIGGGPAGATAAILLAEAGWSVALVEQKEFPRRKVCGEYLSATNWPLLARLGVAERFAELAGPPVRETAIFVGNRLYRAQLPDAGDSFGRALSREKLDSLLMERAAECGVAIFQPARCTALSQRGALHSAIIEPHKSQPLEVTASIVIAAHGSWEIGNLATQRQPATPVGSDWLAFKAHFRETNLPAGLMPLLAFPDGYGGMVHCDGGRASLSCCIRRHRLERLARSQGISAGEAVLSHISESCGAVRTVLEGAELDGPWLAAGAIQPGIRPRYKDGVLIVGNAAGEAHPVVAEGISMAMQSAWLLTERVKNRRNELAIPAAMTQIANSYSAAWRRAFAPRIFAAAAIAQWASRPRLLQAAGPLLRAFPRLLTWGARLSGKSHVVVSDRSATATKECYQA